jgi:membrane protein
MNETLSTRTEPSRFSAKSLWALLKLTWSEWTADNGTSLAAALAYYAVFSLAPILIIAVAVAGIVFGEEAARGELTDQISGFVGEQGADLTQTMLANANKPSIGSLAGLLGLATLLFGATGAFSQMQKALNEIWNVPRSERSGIWHTVTTRFISFLLVLGVGLLLLVMLILSALISGLTNLLGASGASAQMWGQIINFVASFAITALLFALIYKVLPDVDIAWRDVWVGALVTSVLFTVGKQLIGIYLGRASVASTYGAAGSLVVVMLWVYYSAQILYLGAEITQVYTRMHGSRRHERAMVTAQSE